jgi:hypothetical protein
LKPPSSDSACRISIRNAVVLEKVAGLGSFLVVVLPSLQQATVLEARFTTYHQPELS